MTMINSKEQFCPTEEYPLRTQARLPSSTSKYTLVSTLIFILVLVANIFSPVDNTAHVTELVSSPVLLLTAHPDDEVMFFAPTIRSLRRKDIDTKILCMSNGNAEGLGETREREFGDSLEVLDIGKENGVVINDSNLKDNMRLYWDSGLLISYVKPFVAKHGIETILTFDDYGISGHANHISLSTAATLLLNTSTKSTTDRSSPRLFHLISQNRALKYTGALSLPFVRSPNSTKMDARGYLQALKAMQQHRSQLVWFRYLYLLFSRYMYINEWEEWTSS